TVSLSSAKPVGASSIIVCKYAGTQLRNVTRCRVTSCQNRGGVSRVSLLRTTTAPPPTSGIIICSMDASNDDEMKQAARNRLVTFNFSLSSKALLASDPCAITTPFGVPVERDAQLT